MPRTSTLSVGENKGRKRIWIEGRYLSKNGFPAGECVSIRYEQGSIVIEASETGNRKVSERRGRPILDLNTNEIVASIGTCARVDVRVGEGRIVITESEVERRHHQRVARKDRSCGSIFSGGGLLDEAAKQAGFTSSFGLEIDDGYTDVWQVNHPGEMFHGSIHEMFDRLPAVELLTGGIPCEPYSNKRRNNGDNKKVTDTAADHPLADMSLWAVFALWKVNPRVAIFEEAPGYLESDVSKVTLAAMRRMGYAVETRIIEGTEQGSLFVRRRAVIAAVAGGPVTWPEAANGNRSLGDYLLEENDPRCEWFDRDSKSWLFEHWEKQSSKGNGFASTKLSPDMKRVPAVTKRYFSQQGDGAVVPHPSRPGVYRWLTVGEVSSLMGLRPDYNLGETKTGAGEVLGQGVLVDVFRRVIASVAGYAY